MIYGSIDGIDLTDVSCTMLLMLYGRALESRSPDPVLHDPAAEKIVDQINSSLARSPLKLFQNLSASKIRRSLQIHAALRSRQYDLYTEEFIQKNIDGIVVNLGCGLDTRYFRLTQKPSSFYDLDLPEVIQLKKRLVEESADYKMVACSVLDHGWMDPFLKEEKPVLLLAEGLLMYLPKPDVINLVLMMGQRIKTGQLIAEMVNDKYTRGLNSWLVGFKFKYELGFQKPMVYLCGITDSAEPESWSDRLKLIDEWSYLSSNSAKLGILRYFRHLKSFNNVQWTARYRIG